MSIVRPIDRWFIERVLPHASAYHGQARRWAPDAEAARDIVQEAYARLITLDNWRELSNPKAYMMMTVRNIAIDRLRQASVLPFNSKADVHQIEFPDEQPDSFARLAARQELAQVRAIIETLPLQCRKVVELRKLHDYSPREIADRLAISVSTVEKHLVKGLRLIMEMRASWAEANLNKDPSREQPLHRFADTGSPVADRARRRNS